MSSLLHIADCLAANRRQPLRANSAEPVAGQNIADAELQAEECFQREGLQVVEREVKQRPNSAVVRMYLRRKERLEAARNQLREEMLALKNAESCVYLLASS